MRKVGIYLFLLANIVAEIRPLHAEAGAANPVTVSVLRGPIPEGYKTPAEVEAILKGLAAQYPQISTLISIGKSHEGRDIWALKITDLPDLHEKGEPAILFNGLHHARELMTVEVVLDIATYLLNGYATQESIRNLVDHNEIWLVPMVNPDGADKVWTENREWRKNKAEPHGVDLNRNYPFQWGACHGSSRAGDSDIYRGPAPGSEPEVQAMMKLVAEVRPVFNISYHSYDETVYYPMGCDGQKADDPVVAEMGKMLASKLIKDDDSGSYKVGTPWEVMYAMDGDDLDWMYATYHVIPFTVEMNHSAQGFQPDYNEWRDPTVKKMHPGWEHLLTQLTQGPQLRLDASAILSPTGEVLTVSWKNSSDPAAVALTTTLRADGTATLVLSPGEYDVSVLPTGKSPVQKHITIQDRPVEWVVSGL